MKLGKLLRGDSLKDKIVLRKNIDGNRKLNKFKNKSIDTIY